MKILKSKALFSNDAPGKSDMKKHLVCLVLLSVVLRFWQLGNIPPGVSHDELDFVNNGYSLVKTGRDLYGDPLHLTVGRRGIVVLPALLSGTFTGVFGLTQFWAKFPAAILGILDAVLIYGISIQLFHHRRAALWTGLAFILSPWALFLSRSMFDPTVCLFLFLTAIFILLRARRLHPALTGFLILNLGLWSYYGALFFYLPLFLLFAYWQRRVLKIRGTIITVILLSVGLIVYYAGTLPAVGRSGELLFQKLPDISAQVVFDRSYSGSARWMNRLFVNKAVVFSRRLAANYLETFNPRMLFVDGDPNRQFGMWGRGELVFWELPLIILGIYWAFTKYRRSAVKLLMILLIAPLTTALSTQIFATRSLLLFPVLLLFSGIGFVKLFSLSHKITLVFICLYLFSSATGLHQYFYRYPVYAAAQWFDYEEFLSKYLIKISTPAVILTPENRQMFYQYYFYTHPDPYAVQTTLASASASSPIHFQNLSFLSDCRINTSGIDLLVIHSGCYPDPTGAVDTIKTEDRSDRVFWYIFKP